jgi:hypothetical protein
MSVEIIHLSMTSAAEAPRLTDVSDGYWLLIKNPNLTEVGRVKIPLTLDDSPELTTFLTAQLARFGIDLAELKT